MICEGQIIMLYTLNLYCAKCQLYLSKTGGEKKEFMFKINMVILFKDTTKYTKWDSLLKVSTLQNYQTWYCQYILF